MAIRFLDLPLPGATLLGLSDLLGGRILGPDLVRPVPAVTAAERAAAQALVAAVVAAGGDDQGGGDVAREYPEAWRTYQQILRAVDELDE